MIVNTKLFFIYLKRRKIKQPLVLKSALNVKTILAWFDNTKITLYIALLSY